MEGQYSGVEPFPESSRSSHGERSWGVGQRVGKLQEKWRGRWGGVQSLLR